MLDLDIKNWAASINDRAPVNGAAINRVKAKFNSNILVAWCNSHTLSNAVLDSGVEFKRLSLAADRAVEIIRDDVASLDSKIEAAEADLAARAKSCSESNTKRGKRKRRKIQARSAMTKEVEPDQDEETLEETVARLQQNVEEAEEKVVQAITNKVKFKENAGGLTKEGFVQHGRSVVAPGWEYYKNIYNTEGGECYKLKQAIMACRIFDPSRSIIDL